jgi:hypothetical protein
VKTDRAVGHGRIQLDGDFCRTNFQLAFPNRARSHYFVTSLSESAPELLASKQSGQENSSVVVTWIQMGQSGPSQSTQRISV